MRTLILSDTHMGRPGTPVTAKALRPLWRDVDRVVMNGDVAEVHHHAYWREAGRQTMLLQDMCEWDGVELTLLSGNHDPYLSDLRHLHLAGGAVFVTHGDVIHPSIAPWSPSARQVRIAYETALAALTADGRDHLQSRLTAAQHASHAEWLELPEQAARPFLLDVLVRPWLVLSVLYYWRVFNEMALDFADVHAPNARFLVFGHTHRPLVMTRRGRTIINTGCYGFPGHPRAVLLDDERISVHRIKRVGDEYRLREDAIAAFGLGEREQRRAA